jgi:hypothetical protein
LSIALQESVNGGITWFGLGAVRIGVCRPDGAHGGIVLDSFKLKEQSRYTGAFYWEEWWPKVRDYFGNDEMAIKRRELACKAQEFINQAQSQDRIPETDALGLPANRDINPNDLNDAE